MPLSLILSLHADEKKILDDYYATFQRDPGRPNLQISELIQYVFGLWSWRQKVEDMFDMVTNDPELFHYHGGDRGKCWELFLIRMRSIRYGWDSHFSKVPRLEADNPGFSLAWIHASDETPFLCPAVEDQPYWAKITEMYVSRLLRPYPFSDSLTLETSEFAIEIPTPKAPSPPVPNSSTAMEHSDLGFRVGLEAGQRKEETGEWEVQKSEPRSVTQVMKEWPYEIWQLAHVCSIRKRSSGYRHIVWEALRHCDFDNLYTQVDEEFVRKDLKAKFSDSNAFLVGDPVDYVDFIPWKDLVVNNSDEKGRVAYWNAPVRLNHDHHLHANMTTYRYCIENDFFLPGHMDDGKVTFLIRSLKNSGFAEKLHDFWICWNDCAITTDATDGEYLLLETIPGRQFRQHFESADGFSAVRSLCKKIDRIRFSSDRKLREMLGLFFDPDYDSLLDPIPFEQITHIDPKPLGQGERGVVYKATWSCPQKMDMPSAEQKIVALKAIKGSDEGKLRRFFKELSVNVATLRHHLSIQSCIQCFGISKTHKNQDSKNETGYNLLPPETYLLVMEYAEFGPLLTYLSRILQGDSSDWPRIRDILVDLTVCVFELHEVGIIHRDLHENNVLIGIDDTSMSEDDLQRQVLKVSDLGESTLSESKLQGGTYGDRSSWAPEVRRGREYSQASDIYAMGYIMAKVVSLQWDICERKHGTRTTSTPKFIADVMRWCLRLKVSERPSAEEASAELGNYGLEETFEMEEVDPLNVFDFEDEGGKLQEESGNNWQEIPD